MRTPIISVALLTFTLAACAKEQAPPPAEAATKASNEV